MATDRLKEASRLLRAGDSGGALALMLEHLRLGRCGPEEMDRIGRMISRAVAPAGSTDAELSVRILGQCTTTWLANALAAEGLARGVVTSVSSGEYDNVMQEAHAGALADVVVLLPWKLRFARGAAGATSDGVRDEVGFWTSVQQVLARRGVTRIVQSGYDAVTAGVYGVGLGGAPGGELDVLRRVNQGLREALPDGAFFLDLERVAGDFGRRHFYDARRYWWTKQPFSEEGTMHLASALWHGVRALVMGPKKVLVLDLDNTLWGGVVGEEGPSGVALGGNPDGEAFVAFQRYCKDLSDRGVILAVASKNNESDALGPFQQNPNMVLKRDDFAAFEATWDPKSTSLQRIAEQLRLGLDSFVFFDDNPAEREQVRMAVPQVEVVEVPADPAGFVSALEQGGWFESIVITAEDVVRARAYRAETERERVRETAGSLDDYLRSLGMEGDIRPLDDADLPRTVQLLGKTNQFNLTTRRHDRTAIEAMRAKERSVALTMRLADRFGDHGLVSVIVAVPVEHEPDPTLRIDTWLMSCRVIGRTAEDFFFSDLVERCRALGYTRLRATYARTAKNAMVADLLPRLGFSVLSEGDPVTEYELDLARAVSPRTYVIPAAARVTGALAGSAPAVGVEGTTS